MPEAETMKNVLFISLGCDKNRVDSERMLGLLSDGRYRITDEEDEADIIIINTCCFIDEAKEESIQTILEMAEYRKNGRCRCLIAAGCLAERYRDEIFKEIPEVDAVVGTHSYTQITDAVEAVLDGEKSSFFRPPSGFTEEEPPRILTTGGFFAYLKIAEGCSRHCTYCVIPSLRGPYYSVPMEYLLKEAEDLAQKGVRELILAAQDTALYGTDLYGEKTLHVLLENLCRIEGISWIRILYVYPEEIYPELVSVMQKEPKICHYLDMPIQHSEDRVLRRMGRRTSRSSLEETVCYLRREIPDIALRTTLITGFPGETEDEHAALLDFIRKMRFERLGVFTYSREEGTPAALMPDQIPEEEKERRRDELLQAQQKISLENGENRIGQILPVFVEGYMPEDGVWTGRSYADAPDVDGLVFFESRQEPHSGDMIRVRITDAGEYDLAGYDVSMEEEAEETI